MGRHDSGEIADSNPSHAPSRSKDENSPSGPSDEGSVNVDDVLSWATSSAYSPLNLQSLPQPRPRDATHVYPDCFTFRDAFEDLLAVNSGRPLSNLQDLMLEKHSEHIRYFPWGMPVASWAVGLGRRGLWEAYFPLSPSARRELSYGYISPRTLWQTDDLTFHQRPSSSRLSILNHPLVHWGSRWEEGHHPWSECEERAPKRETATQEKEAELEDDLYAAVESKFAVDGPATTPDIQKVSNVKSGATENKSTSDSEEAPVVRTMKTPGGGEILETVQRRVRNGKNETRTTTQQFDAHGNMIALSESTRIWSSWKTSKDREKSEATDETEDATSKTSGRDMKPTGWFWR
ncbi:RNA recognition motif-containing protein [Hypoxylon texense]